MNVQFIYEMFLHIRIEQCLSFQVESRARSAELEVQRCFISCELLIIFGTYRHHVKQ